MSTSEVHPRPVECRACQDSQRKSASEGHSQTVEHRGIDKSGERKKACSKGYSRPIERRGRDRSGERKKADERWALTNCRAQRDGQIRTMKKKPMSEGHPRSVERRGGDRLG